jgi:hypothetical protein
MGIYVLYCPPKRDCAICLNIAIVASSIQEKQPEEKQGNKLSCLQKGSWGGNRQGSVVVIDLEPNIRM